MYMFINAMILALLVPSSTVQKADDGPACRAQLSGLELLTTVELPNGMVVDGPWRVLHTGDTRGGVAHFVMFATLDRVIERDVLTGDQNVISFPAPVQLSFEGTSQLDLIRQAAQVWCVTVMRAQENQTLDRLAPQQAQGTRIAALPPLLIAG